MVTFMGDIHCDEPTQKIEKRTRKMQEQKPNGEMENMNQDNNFLKFLFQLTMQKEWESVVEFYKTSSWAHKAKLTKSEETALHVAVSSCSGRTGTKPTYIKRMIDSIHKNEEYNVLSMQNSEGNTPLHLAATVGSVAICVYIAMKCPSLIMIRNSKGETPVFKAARHGNTEAFLCFHLFYNEKKEERQEERPEEFESLCRRHDGNTVLHSAIYGAYFRLAHQIICYYPNLVNSVNVDGESPLHVLAKKPNVFKSRSYLGFYDSIIYYCLPVDELKRQKYYQGADQNLFSPTSEINFPENYRTCVNIFHLLSDPILCSIKAGLESDEENQQIIGAESQSADHSVRLGPGTYEEERNDDGFFPPNYATCILLVKFGFKVILTVLGFWRIQKIQEKKQRWTHSLQVMNRMIELSESSYNYDIDGQKPVPKLEPLYPGRIDQLPSTPPTDDDINPQSSTETNTGTTPSREVQKHTEKEKDQSHSVENRNETPILVAAKTGITEMVEKILEKCPIAILDLDSNEKNVLLLAAENRQTSIFDYLVKLNLPYMFRQVDDRGNGVLHLAAVFGESHPWRIPGAALQMQCEMKWYKHVKNSIPQQYLPQQNFQGETPRQIFTETHRTLVKDGTGWLIKTSESCSLIAALIATVAFATAATVPGGLDEQSGYPILRGHKAFDVFSISSLLALLLSVIALVFFLGIITSRCQEQDFKTNLPRKLLTGLTCLFSSIAAMLVSFCAGHTFILWDQVKIAVFSIYATTGVAVTLFALGHLNLYFDFLQAAYKKVPLRSYKVFYQ